MYPDILSQSKDGHNMYMLVASNRATVVESGHRVDGTPIPAQIVQNSHLAAAGARLKTIPNSNLSARKQQVLRVHKENLKMV